MGVCFLCGWDGLESGRVGVEVFEGFHEASLHVFFVFVCLIRSSLRCWRPNWHPFRGWKSLRLPGLSLLLLLLTRLLAPPPHQVLSTRTVSYTCIYILVNFCLPSSVISCLYSSGSPPSPSTPWTCPRCCCRCYQHCGRWCCFAGGHSYRPRPRCLAHSGHR